MYTEIITDETFMIGASWVELLRVGIYRGRHRCTRLWGIWGKLWFPSVMAHCGMGSISFFRVIFTSAGEIFLP